MPQKHYHGIAISDDGHYVSATVIYKGEKWQLAGVHSLSRQNLFRQIMLLHNGLYIGVPCFWKKSTSFLSKPDMDELPAHDLFKVAAYTKEINRHASTFAGNLLGIIPDEAFLATLPMFLLGTSKDSFLSIYAGSDHYRIGVICNRRLVISFRMTPAEPDKLAGYLGRIERYWTIQSIDDPFPREIYTLGKQELIPQAIFSAPTRHVGMGEKNDASLAALQAAGVALAQIENPVPPFKGSTLQASFRKIRSFAYIGSSVIVAAALMLLLVSAGLNLWCQQNFNKTRAAYTSQILENSELQSLNRQCRSLAGQVIELDRIFRNRTNWARFLCAMAQARPIGLCLERMGCNEESKNADEILIALTGSVINKDLINKYIGTLEEYPFIVRTKLLSLESSPKKSLNFRFKIVCTLKLTKT
jgi:hypothetical protein